MLEGLGDPSSSLVCIGKPSGRAGQGRMEDAETVKTVPAVVRKKM